MPSYAPPKPPKKRTFKRPRALNPEWPARLAQLRFYSGQLASIAANPVDLGWFQAAQQACALSATLKTNKQYMHRVQLVSKYISYGLGTSRPKGAEP